MGLHVEYAHDDDADKDHQNGGVVLGTQLFLQEDAAPKHGCGTVRGNDRRAHGDVRIVRQRVDVEELTNRFANSTDVLRRFRARRQLFVLDENDICARNQTGEEEGQLIGDVRGILIQRFQNEAVGERSRRIENTIGNRQEQRKQGLGILVIARLLTGGAKLVVLGRFRDAQRDDADGNQRDGGKLPAVAMVRIATSAPEELQIGEEMDSSM